MLHIVERVCALPNFKLRVFFAEGITKIYNMAPLISTMPAFLTLEDNPSEFLNVKVDIGGHGILWSDNLDLSSEELWENSIVDKTQV